MKGYGVSLTALNDFLASSTSVSVSGLISPRFECVHACMLMRTSRNDFASCNGYVYEFGMCRLGYKEPDWIMEQSQSSEKDGQIYFDVVVP